MTITQSKTPFDAFGRTDTGRRRENNEDSFTCDPDNGIFLVADGMGGEAHGETASRITSEIFVESVMPFLIDQETTVPFEHSSNGEYFMDIVKHAAGAANSAVFDYAKSHASHQGMGSTLSAVVAHGEKLYIAHVGDSRMYKITGRSIDQISVDHTTVQEMVSAGMISRELARTHPKKNVITRCIGRGKSVRIDVAVENIEADTVYLLCSDGLNDMLEDECIRTLVTESVSLEQACQNLITEANQRGGRDNITVVLFKRARGNN